MEKEIINGSSSQQAGTNIISRACVFLIWILEQLALHSSSHQKITSATLEGRIVFLLAGVDKLRGQLLSTAGAELSRSRVLWHGLISWNCTVPSSAGRYLSSQTKLP
ncbi:hypothetical protein SLA2020_231170 [Shorea laevis]